MSTITQAATLLAFLLLPAQSPQRIPVTFTGGYETDPRDRGRPVILIAAALNVSAPVFREAFSHVKPASGGREPEPEQVRLNKSALMHALAPLGVTNERLDEVSNYYRYSRERGDRVWRATPATAYATVVDGTVTGFTITDPGSGYSSAPAVSVPGFPNLKAQATLSFSTDLARNGGIQNLSAAPR